MEFNNNSDKKIIKPKIITDNIYLPNELYFNEIICSNVYKGEDLSHNQYFMIKIPTNIINNNLLDKLYILNSIQNKTLLNAISVFKKNIKPFSYIIFDYNDGIRLTDYILYSNPSIKIRINLLKYFLLLLIDLYNINELNLYNLNSDFIFVSNFENPFIKILFNIEGTIQNKIYTNNNFEIQEKENEFLWLARFIYILCSNSEKEEEKNNHLKFLESLNIDIKETIIKIFNKIFHKIKGDENYLNYNLKDFILDFNNILEFFDINIIDINLLYKNINKKEINYKNLINKLYEKSKIKEKECFEKITNINNNKIILGLKSKRIKKKLIKKKQNMKNFNNLYDKNKNDHLSNLDDNNFQNNSINLNKNFLTNYYYYPYSDLSNFSKLIKNNLNQLIYNNYLYNFIPFFNLNKPINNLISSFEFLNNKMNNELNNYKYDMNNYKYYTYNEFLQKKREKEK